MATAVKGTPRAPPATPSLDDRIMDMVRIMAKVANRDFSEKPALVDGNDPLSFLTVGFRFMIEDLERALGDLERERAELQRANEKLQSLDAAKTRFINTAAHELGTPLTPILLQLAMLREGSHGPLSPKQSNSLEMLERNLNRLAYLVKDMLDVARLESRRMRLRIAECDVATLAQQVVQSYADQAQRLKLGLSYVGAGSAKVLADETRVSQVLINLVSNALKFTPAGGAVVLQVQAEGDGVRVSTTDSGQGLTGEEIGRLFQPFTQIDEVVANADRTGTGLGLFISRGIVELHGGSIGCTSAGRGHGSTFHFWLPRVAQVSPDAASQLDDS